MSFVVRGLLGVASIACPALAQAQAAPAAPAPVSAPSAPEPSAPEPSAPEPSAPAPLRLYMRNEGPPLTFSARAESGNGNPNWCISPCDVRLSPGNYRLELNGLPVDETITLRQPGTMRGEYQSRAAAREGAWLALNVGGIIGGVLITVGLAGGPKWAYYAGGGALVGAGAIFLLTYRTDRAKVSFTPDPPPDVHGLPEPAPISGTRQAMLEPPSPRSMPRGVGFRIVF